MRRAAQTAITILFWSSHAIACSYAFPKYNVSASFQVKMALEGRLLPGAWVSLERHVNGEPYLVMVAEKVTDTRGRASFDHLEPGEYFVNARYLSMWSAAELTASAKGSRRREIDLSIPKVNAIEARRLGGTATVPVQLVTSAGKKEKAWYGLEGAKVEVRSFATKQLVATEMLGAEALFEVLGAAPGLYEITFSEPEGSYQETFRHYPTARSVGRGDRIEGAVIVRVDPNAPRETLSLHLTETGCGLEDDWPY